jgi:ribonuclease VapC
MVVDTSAILAVLLRQGEFAALNSALIAAAPSTVGTPTLAEAAIVLQARMGPAGLSALRSFLLEYDVRPADFGDDHWRSAAQAFGRFGKGRHPAALNFGDCMTYATARLAGEPLLCVGDDFAQTDLDLVPLPSQP